jgi:hypothetical protein
LQEKNKTILWRQTPKIRLDTGSQIALTKNTWRRVSDSNGRAAVSVPSAVLKTAPIIRSGNPPWFASGLHDALAKDNHAGRVIYFSRRSPSRLWDAPAFIFISKKSETALHPLENTRRGYWTQDGFEIHSPANGFLVPWAFRA